MKRTLSITAIIMAVMVIATCFAGCEKEPEEYEPPVIKNSSSQSHQLHRTDKTVLAVSNIDTTAKEITLDIYRAEPVDDGYKITKNEKRGSVTYKYNDETVFLMGDIFNVKQGDSIEGYDKTTTEAEFIANAQKQYNGEPLYFIIKHKDGNLERIQLWWEHYFIDG